MDILGEHEYVSSFLSLYIWALVCRSIHSHCAKASFQDSPNKRGRSFASTQGGPEYALYSANFSLESVSLEGVLPVH